MRKSDVKVGDQVEFLRMSNKAVKQSGKIVKIHDGASQCVDVQVDGTGGGIETAHVDDVRRSSDPKASKDMLHVGDRVKFLRMNNKAIELKGTIVAIHGGSVPCVDVEVDGTDGGPETAHVDDVVVMEPAKKAKKEEAKKD